MAEFTPKDTFLIKSKNYLVILGDLQSGTIDRGMTLILKHKWQMEENTMRIPIRDFCSVQTRNDNNQPTSKFGVCIEYDEYLHNIVKESLDKNISII